MVKVSATLVATYKNQRIAEAVGRAISTDNTKQIETKIEGEKIITKINSNSIGSIKSSLDDIIRNQNIAEEMVK